MSKRSAHYHRDVMLWEFWPEEVTEKRWFLQCKTKEARHAFASDVASIRRGKNRHFALRPPQNSWPLHEKDPAWAEWEDPVWAPPRDPRLFVEDLGIDVGRHYEKPDEFSGDLELILTVDMHAALVAALRVLSGPDPSTVPVKDNQFGQGVLHIHPDHET